MRSVIAAMLCLALSLGIPVPSLSVARAVEPATAVTAISTAVSLLKELNELNRGVLQTRQLKDIVERLDVIEAQLDVLNAKLDIAIAGILRIEKRVEQQWQLTVRGDLLGHIRAVNTYYPGWKKKCLTSGKLECDAKTLRAIQLQHNDLVNAVRVFMERDDYSNVHLVVLAMGYERDLLVLMDTPEHYNAVFTLYSDYLDGAIAHLESARAKVTEEMRQLEAASKPWETTQDFCATGTKVHIYHHQEQRNCLYCLVELFSGNFRDGWKRTSGYAARDGQGSDNCYDPEGDRSNESYSPVGNVSCEYMLEHRNCAHLTKLEETRSQYDALKNETDPQLLSLADELRASAAMAREWAAGKINLEP
jgi:hypothetical protein